jgi:hypothetical protein
LQEDQTVAFHDDVPPVHDDNVDETSAGICEGGCELRFEDVRHGVDVRQDINTAEDRDDARAGGRDERDQERLFEAVSEVQAFDIRQDVEAAKVHDDARAGGRDKRDQERLFEAITEVQAFDVRQDVEVAKVRDDAQAGVRDERDQKTLFEAVTEVQAFDDSPTRPKRSLKPNPRYSPDDYDLNCVSGKLRTKSRRSIRRAGGPSR